jgi:LysM domain-containing protein
VADDQSPPPKPRPRRRRTDIDPNAPSPPVAHERRRKRKPAAAPDPTVDPAVLAALAASGIDGPPVPVEPQNHDASGFHVPGMVAAAAVVAGATGDDDDHAPTEDRVGPSTAPEARPTWLGMLDDRSPDPGVCPFLRSTGERGLAAPIEAPDQANRCAALAEAVPQSLRQQELVCLTTGHVNCPRYLRGAAVMTETPTVTVREGRAMSPAMIGSLVVLVMALTASVAFVLARGGALDISSLGPSPSSPVVGLASPSVSPAPAASPSTVAQATPSPTPTPTATPTPTPTPTPTAAPTRTPRPTPSSDRYQLLRACSGASNCWIYTVRRGDNVFSIARYFGVSQDSIYARNPWLRNSGLRAGQELRLPRPTR